MSNEAEIDLNLDLGRIIERIENLNLTVDTLKSESVPISTSFNNVNKSCKVIEVNPSL